VSNAMRAATGHTAHNIPVSAGPPAAACPSGTPDGVPKPVRTLADILQASKGARVSTYATDPDDLADWFIEVLPAEDMDVFQDSLRDLTIFRASFLVTNMTTEIAISEAALEDWPFEDISRDLIAQGALDWLRTRPEFRIFYLNDRKVRFHESLTIRCADELFRVIRETDGSVRFFTSGNRELSPTVARIATWSIHSRTDHEWCSELQQLVRE
jgi:hypothetical protein